MLANINGKYRDCTIDIKKFSIDFGDKHVSVDNYVEYIKTILNNFGCVHILVNSDSLNKTLTPSENRDLKNRIKIIEKSFSKNLKYFSA